MTRFVAITLFSNILDLDSEHTVTGNIIVIVAQSMKGKGPNQFGESLNCSEQNRASKQHRLEDSNQR